MGGSENRNDFWKYDTIKEKWEEIKNKGSYPISISHCNFILFKKNQLLLSLGSTAPESSFSFYSFDLKERVWSQFHPTLFKLGLFSKINFFLTSRFHFFNENLYFIAHNQSPTLSLSCYDFS